MFPIEKHPQKIETTMPKTQKYDQPQTYEQPQTYQQPQIYNHPHTYEKPQSYDQPNKYDETQEYEEPKTQPQTYVQPQTQSEIYEEPQQFVNPQTYDEPQPWVTDDTSDAWVTEVDTSDQYSDGQDQGEQPVNDPVPWSTSPHDSEEVSHDWTRYGGDPSVNEVEWTETWAENSWYGLSDSDVDRIKNSWDRQNTDNAQKSWSGARFGTESEDDSDVRHWSEEAEYWPPESDTWGPQGDSWLDKDEYNQPETSPEIQRFSDFNHEGWTGADVNSPDFNNWPSSNQAWSGVHGFGGFGGLNHNTPKKKPKKRPKKPRPLKLKLPNLDIIKIKSPKKKRPHRHKKQKTKLAGFPLLRPRLPKKAWRPRLPFRSMKQNNEVIVGDRYYSLVPSSR